MLTGLGFQVSMRVGALLSGGKNAHLLPVVSKLLAAIETYNVRASLESSRRSSLTCLAGHGEANSLMGTAEQYIEYFHLLLLELAPALGTPELLSYK